MTKEEFELFEATAEARAQVGMTWGEFCRLHGLVWEDSVNTIQHKQKIATLSHTLTE